jgi:2'-deoxynucleoside 5'-phosphate N-hydrolase
MKIYFAGSITGGRDDSQLYAEIIKLLQIYGEVLTEHIGDGALTRNGEEDISDKEIHNRDLAWLKEADLLVAEVTTPSLGVGYEIGRAIEWKTNVVCLYRSSAGRRLSRMITGNFEIVIIEYESLAELPAALKNYFNF